MSKTLKELREIAMGASSAEFEATFNFYRVWEMLDLLREAELYVIEHAGCYPQPNRMDAWLERLEKFERGGEKE